MSTWVSSLRSLFSRNPELDPLMSPHSAHSVGVWGDSEETSRTVYKHSTLKVEAKDGTTIINFSVLFDSKGPNQDIRRVMADNPFEEDYHEVLLASGYNYDSEHSKEMTLKIDGRDVRQIVYVREPKPIKSALRSIFCCKPNVSPTLFYNEKDYFVGYTFTLPESARAGRRHRR